MKVLKLLCYLIFFISQSNFQAQAKNNSQLLKKIVIDAGHGGHDVGCVGNRLHEKDIALKIALKLGQYIEENFNDVEVVYTRKNDTFLGLQERAAIANQAKADLFICIHVNANHKKEVAGTETFVMGLHKSEAQLDVAKRENSAILLEDDYKIQYQDFDPNSPESTIALALRQSAFLEHSLSFASLVQEEFQQKAKRIDRGVKQAGFLVLWQTAMPSVLIETGFLTNKEEEDFLNQTKGQELIASAIYRAFKRYKIELESKNMAIKHPTEEKQNKPVFKIQLAASKQENQIKIYERKGLTPISIYKEDNFFRYLHGNFPSYQEAQKKLNIIKEQGYTDAYIIAFFNGEKIAVQKAQELLNN